MNSVETADTAAGYLDDLGARLRELGLPAEHVRVTVADLAAHLAECGGVAEEEFGPVEEFARELAPEGAGRADPPGPDGDSRVEVWRWTADTFVDEELLGRFGDEGWEMRRVDALGRFVCHRDLDRPQRWEYRRELVSRGREGLDERLAPEGWEACGDWVVYAWFKRPRAASLGPAAELSTVPSVPSRWNFFSRRFYALLGLLAAALAASGVTVALRDGDATSGLGYVAGLLAGAAVPVAGFLAWRRWRSRRP
ncbi:hypothetical protein [Streptomyces flavofungini]|uniref:DUF2812 domain-containing protein n=1 Tax=Streptomyces flavofungini TaxID=68200 RepID=A0ABS0X3F8_9ACTN|nr:hypothetical protein [Streptomyces flavofungini]MBJ3807708.1 hypothetical protein [Streptomyces flavofungini]GHC63817.1 hypothetical protein GCM10010349_34570 [Streptomyces flavofungini]